MTRIVARKAVGNPSVRLRGRAAVPESLPTYVDDVNGVRRDDSWQLSGGDSWAQRGGPTNQSYLTRVNF